jgi:hypothetical protein
MSDKQDYADRALRLRSALEELDDPVARVILRALADAFEDAAADQLAFAGKKPSPKRRH